MKRSYKLISLIVLVCFVFNTTVSDLALSQPITYRASADKLAAPYATDDIAGIERLDKMTIEMLLTAQLKALSRTDMPISLATFQTILGKDTGSPLRTFTPPGLQFFFHEIKPTTAGLCVMCRFRESVFEAPRTYYALFSTEPAEDGGFNIKVIDEDQFKLIRDREKKLIVLERAGSKELTGEFSRDTYQAGRMSSEQFIVYSSRQSGKRRTSAAAIGRGSSTGTSPDVMPPQLGELHKRPVRADRSDEEIFFNSYANDLYRMERKIRITYKDGLSPFIVLLKNMAAQIGATGDLDSLSQPELAGRSEKLRGKIRPFENRFRKAHQVRDNVKLAELNGQIIELLKTRLKTQLVLLSYWLETAKTDRRKIGPGVSALRGAVSTCKRISSEYGWQRRRGTEKLLVEKIRSVGRHGIPIETFLYKDLDVKVFPKDREHPAARVTIRQERWVTVSLQGDVKARERRWRDVSYGDWPSALRSQIHTIASQEEYYGDILYYIADLDYCRERLSDARWEIPDYIREQIEESLANAFMWARRAKGENGRRRAAANLELAFAKLGENNIPVVMKEIINAIDNLRERRLEIEKIKANIDKRLESIYIHIRNLDVTETLREAQKSFKSGGITRAGELVLDLYDTYFGQIVDDSAYKYIQEKLSQLMVTLDRLRGITAKGRQGEIEYLNLADDFRSGVAHILTAVKRQETRAVVARPAPGSPDRPESVRGSSTGTETPAENLVLRIANALAAMPDEPLKSKLAVKVRKALSDAAKATPQKEPPENVSNEGYVSKGSTRLYLLHNTKAKLIKSEDIINSPGLAELVKEAEEERITDVPFRDTIDYYLDEINPKSVTCEIAGIKFGPVSLEEAKRNLTTALAEGLSLETNDVDIAYRQGENGTEARILLASNTTVWGPQSASERFRGSTSGVAEMVAPDNIERARKLAKGIGNSLKDDIPFIQPLCGKVETLLGALAEKKLDGTQSPTDLASLLKRLHSEREIQISPGEQARLRQMYPGLKNLKAADVLVETALDQLKTCTQELVTAENLIPLRRVKAIDGIINDEYYDSIFSAAGYGNVKDVAGLYSRVEITDEEKTTLKKTSLVLMPALWEIISHSGSGLETAIGKDRIEVSYKLPGDSVNERRLAVSAPSARLGYPADVTWYHPVLKEVKTHCPHPADIVDETALALSRIFGTAAPEARPSSTGASLMERYIDEAMAVINILPIVAEERSPEIIDKVTAVLKEVKEIVKTNPHLLPVAEGIGVWSEIKPGEERTALVPDVLKILNMLGIATFVQRGTGTVGDGNSVGFKDADYESDAVDPVIHHFMSNPADIFGQEDIGVLTHVKELQPQEIALLKETATRAKESERSPPVVFCFNHFGGSFDELVEAAKTGATFVSFENIVEPKTGRKPILKGPSEKAGVIGAYQMALYLTEKSNWKEAQKSDTARKIKEAIEIYDKTNEPPVPAIDLKGKKVVIFGGGTVGYNQAKILARMGADVTIIEKKKDRIMDLGPVFSADGISNIVIVLSDDTSRINGALAAADGISTAAYVEGMTARHLISKKQMEEISERGGAVFTVIDRDQGGGVEGVYTTTHEDPVYADGNNVIYAVSNIPALVSKQTSIDISLATMKYLILISIYGLEKAIELCPELGCAVDVAGGKITNPAIQKNFPDASPDIRMETDQTRMTPFEQTLHRAREAVAAETRGPAPRRGQRPGDGLARDSSAGTARPVITRMSEEAVTQTIERVLEIRKAIIYNVPVLARRFNEAKRALDLLMLTRKEDTARMYTPITGEEVASLLDTTPESNDVKITMALLKMARPLTLLGGDILETTGLSLYDASIPGKVMSKMDYTPVKGADNAYVLKNSELSNWFATITPQASDLCPALVTILVQGSVRPYLRMLVVHPYKMPSAEEAGRQAVDICFMAGGVKQKGCVMTLTEIVTESGLCKYKVLTKSVRGEHGIDIKWREVNTPQELPEAALAMLKDLQSGDMWAEMAAARASTAGENAWAHWPEDMPIKTGSIVRFVTALLNSDRDERSRLISTENWNQLVGLLDKIDETGVENQEDLDTIKFALAAMGLFMKHKPSTYRTAENVELVRRFLDHFDPFVDDAAREVLETAGVETTDVKTAGMEEKVREVKEMARLMSDAGSLQIEIGRKHKELKSLHDALAEVKGKGQDTTELEEREAALEKELAGLNEDLTKIDGRLYELIRKMAGPSFVGGRAVVLVRESSAGASTGIGTLKKSASDEPGVSAVNAVLERDPIRDARDVGRRIPTHPTNPETIMYTLVVDSRLYRDGEYKNDISGYLLDNGRYIGAGDRFNIERADTGNIQNILSHIDPAKASKTIVQVSRELNDDEIKLLKEKAPGVRVVRVATASAGMDELNTNERRDYRFDLYAYMLAAREVTEADIQNQTSVYRILELFVKAHLGDDVQNVGAAATDYILNLAKNDISSVIKYGLSYRPVARWDVPKYHNITATLIAA